MRALLIKFEKSITKGFNQKKTGFPAINVLGWSAKQPILKPHTYPWLENVSARSLLYKQCLSTIEIHHYSIRDIPAFKDVVFCDECARLSLDPLWNVTVKSLFNISDAWHGGQPNNIDKCRLILAKDLDLKALVSLFSIMNLLAAEWVSFTCGGVVVDDTLELECVYRELLLKHGPYFLWASRNPHGSKEQMWVRDLVWKGWEALKFYETGEVVASTFGKNQKKISHAGEPKSDRQSEVREPTCVTLPSLHSILLRELCKKAGCTMQTLWDAVHDLLHDMID